ncbi:MAG TPA: shikimate kinase [Candidatus Tumulicola sp.]|jgi:shikimate kinase
MKRHIALVGFMASGKSTIGKRLARKLGCAFFDTDEVVVRAHGPVSDIFYQEGEAAFRRYERAALDQVLDGEAGVVSLGGGALSDEANVAALKKRAYRIFVKVSPEQVLERLRHSRRVRPLLGPAPSLARIKELYTKRMPQYAHADYVVEADDLSTAQVVDDVVQWLHKKKIAL